MTAFHPGQVVRINLRGVTTAYVPEAVFKIISNSSCSDLLYITDVNNADQILYGNIYNTTAINPNLIYFRVIINYKYVIDNNLSGALYTLCWNSPDAGILMLSNCKLINSEIYKSNSDDLWPIDVVHQSRAVFKNRNTNKVDIMPTEINSIDLELEENLFI